MAKRGRPRKTAKVEDKVEDIVEETTKEETTAEEVNDFVKSGITEADPDISDVDYTEKGGDGKSYNPFGESVEEKSYRTPQVEKSPLIPEINEPVFERPSLKDLVQANEEQAKEDGMSEEAGFENLSQDEIKELPQAQQDDSAEGLVELSLGLYTIGCGFMGKFAQISERKFKNLVEEGLIDPNLSIPVDPYTKKSMPEIIQNFNTEVQDAFHVTEDFKDTVRPVMKRVFVKRGWGATDEQQLMMLFGMDLIQKGGVVIQMKKAADYQLEAFMKMTEKTRPSTPVNNSQEEDDGDERKARPVPSMDEIKEMRNRAANSSGAKRESVLSRVKKRAQAKQEDNSTDMVDSVNPDIKINQDDLKQVDVDNV